MLVTIHKNGHVAGTEKEAVCKCYNSFLTLNMHKSPENIYYIFYKCSVTIMTIISINDLWL